MSFRELQDQLGEKSRMGLIITSQQAIEKMEKTELDLVNKRISQETINRQKDILTRMLKAENALTRKRVRQ